MLETQITTEANSVKITVVPLNQTVNICSNCKAPPRTVSITLSHQYWDDSQSSIKDRRKRCQSGRTHLRMDFTSIVSVSVPLTINFIICSEVHWVSGVMVGIDNLLSFAELRTLWALQNEHSIERMWNKHGINILILNLRTLKLLNNCYHL